MIAALVVSPQRRRVRAYFRLYPDANLNGERVESFLRQLLRTLRVPVELIWDRLNVHCGEPVKSFLARRKQRLRMHLLPAYAPELNPVELIWSYAKANPMANFAPRELSELVDRTEATTREIESNERLLRSFLQHSPLSLRLR